jgi:hypothetical protein
VRWYCTCQLVVGALLCTAVTASDQHRRLTLCGCEPTQSLVCHAVRKPNWLGCLHCASLHQLHDGVRVHHAHYVVAAELGCVLHVSLSTVSHSQVAAVIKRCEAQSAAVKGRCSELERYMTNCIKVGALSRALMRYLGAAACEI